MPLSSPEQQIIEDMVAAASPDQRDNMRLDAEAALRQINNLMARRLLSQAALPLDFPHYGFEFDNATFVFAWGEENTRASNSLCPVIDGLGNALRATGLSSPQQAKQKNSLS